MYQSCHLECKMQEDCNNEYTEVLIKGSHLDWIAQS